MWTVFFVLCEEVVLEPFHSRQTSFPNILVFILRRNISIPLTLPVIFL